MCSFVSHPQGFVRAYASILAAASAPANTYAPYRTILLHLASPGDGPGGLPAPILVHCKGGKDRTGVLCALLLGLCGVADEVIAHECMCLAAFLPSAGAG